MPPSNAAGGHIDFPLLIFPLGMPLKQIPAIHSNQFQLRLDFRF